MLGYKVNDVLLYYSTYQFISSILMNQLDLEICEKVFDPFFCFNINM